MGTYWTGLVDQDDRLFETAFPGPLAPVFGIENEETDILYPEEQPRVESLPGNGLGLKGDWKAATYCALIESKGAEVLARYGSEFYAGSPSLTGNTYGKGAAYYIGFRGDHEFHTQFYGKLAEKLGLRRALSTVLPEGVTAQVRQAGDKQFLFLLNFSGVLASVELGGLSAIDMDSGKSAGNEVCLEPHSVRILLEVTQ